LHATDVPAAVTIAQDDNNVKQWQQELLGEYADVNKLTAENLRQAYITLLESARAKQSTWSDQEWKKVQAVINQLDARKNVVEKELGTDDKAKIKLLQGELRALETKGDIKD
jgi:polyhydroxyalkanoate synthesis regulator phasin